MAFRTGQAAHVGLIFRAVSAGLGLAVLSQGLRAIAVQTGHDLGALTYVALTFWLALVFVACSRLYLATHRYVEERVAAGRTASVFILPGEERWPFRARWVFVYLPGAVLELAAVIAATPAVGPALRICAGGMLCVVLQTVWFVLLPTRVPASFRDVTLGTGLADALVRRMWAHDGPYNALPSGHCSLAVYVGLSLAMLTHPIVLCWPLLVCVSCLYTRQHTIPDVLAGAAFGAALFAVTRPV